jgi:predicted nucleotidyltransferase
MDTVADVEAVAEQLRAMKDELAARHDVGRLGVWRDGAGDLAVLVAFGDAKPGLVAFLGLEHELSGRLGLGLRLVSTDGLTGERRREAFDAAVWA